MRRPKKPYMVPVRPASDAGVFVCGKTEVGAQLEGVTLTTAEAVALVALGHRVSKLLLDHHLGLDLLCALSMTVIAHAAAAPILAKLAQATDGRGGA